jgi:hypothetical protein
MRAFIRAAAGLCLAGAAFAAGAQQDLQPAVQTSPPPTPVPSAGTGATGGATRSEPAGRPKPVAAARPSAAAPARTAAPAAATGAAPAASAAPAPKGGKSSDRIELDTTQISGNRELPKVMYVVPWRRAGPGEFTGRPLNSLLDEALTPVDRDVFRRQNRYYAELSGEPGSDRSQPAADGAGAAAPTPKDEK